MTARVFVTLKKGVLDPQGKAVERSLAKLGFPEARDVRVGRFIDLAVDASSHGGCLAPHSHLRGAIIPTPRQQGVDEEAATDPGSPRWSWARLLKRVFALDMGPNPTLVSPAAKSPSVAVSSISAK